MKLFLISVFIIALLFFIASSFYDKKIMDFFVGFYKVDIIHWISTWSYELGSMLLIGFIVPICLICLSDRIIIVNKDKRVFRWLYMHKNAFLIFLFWVFLIIGLSNTTHNSIQNIWYGINNQVMISIDKVDLAHLLTYFQVGVINLLMVLMILLFNVLFFFIYLKDMIMTNYISENNLIKPTITMIYYMCFCFAAVFVIKHISGRPLYSNSVWTRQNAINMGLNPNNSVEEMFKIYGWDFFDPKGLGRFSPAKYHEWWEPNDTLKNWKNWFTYPEKDFWIDLEDNYMDMDFPSGHIMSYSNLLATCYFFYFTKSYKQTEKFSNVQKSLFSLCLILIALSIFTLMIQMFHWPTDILFSICAACLIFVGCQKLTNKNRLKKLIK
ncbi:phosphatase PAP2 family protein [Entomoplasma ellychniae]|nr:phosphatase PAP2 family protein [Entomoplasma ellychniae]